MLVSRCVIDRFDAESPYYFANAVLMMYGTEECNDIAVNTFLLREHPDLSLNSIQRCLGQLKVLWCRCSLFTYFGHDAIK
jgi:hypothetical protein